jgi:hypothetical protein
LPLIRTVTSPYVVKLTELHHPNDQKPEESAKDDNINGEREFIATRVNMFGLTDDVHFQLKDAVRITSGGHPFASVKVKGQNMYIFGGKVADPTLRRALTNEV